MLLNKFIYLKRKGSKFNKVRAFDSVLTSNLFMTAIRIANLVNLKIYIYIKKKDKHKEFYQFKILIKF